MNFNLKENSGFDIHKIRFCLSSGYRAPIIPILDIDEDFYYSRLNELDLCFEELNEAISKIDASTNKGHADLFKALHVATQLRNYKSNIDNKFNKNKYAGYSPVPYTASDKGRNQFK